MTEKQFTFIRDSVAPNIKTPIVFNNEKMSISEVLDKLNDLDDEVMDLRVENTKFKLVVGEIIKDMQKYVDDDQLVYINQSYVDWIKKELDLTLYSKKEDLK